MPPATCWQGCWHSPRSPLPAAATRSSGTPTSRSSRKRRPSHRTSRAPSAWPSRSAVRGDSESPRTGPSTRSPSARSATPARTTRPRRARSMPRVTRRTAVSRCPCCSSARTTDGESACRHRPAGSSRRSGREPGCSIGESTAPTPSACSPPRASSQPPCARPANRRCSTSAPFGTSVTPEPMSSRAIAPRDRFDVTTNSIRSSRPLVIWSMAERRRHDLIEQYLESRAEMRVLALAMAGSGTIDRRADVIAPLSPRRPDGRRSARGVGGCAGRSCRVRSRMPCRKTVNRSRSPRPSTERSSTFWRSFPTRSCSARTWASKEVSTASHGGSRSGSELHGCSTPCSTSSRYWVWRWAQVCPACCRSPRSSISRTSTTPRTNCVARRPACRSSPTGSIATRSWCGSPASRTRRGSAGTSTTTTRSPCCATSPGW